jgi:hypothetical protein
MTEYVAVFFYMMEHGWPSGMVSGKGIPGIPGWAEGIMVGPSPGMMGIPSSLNSKPGANS